MPKVSTQHMQERRQQIIDAAFECFAEKGFHATTVQDLVQRSGLSAGAIYRYFPSKEAIVNEVARDRHAKERSLLAVRPDADLRDTLREIGRAFFASLTDPEEMERRSVGVQIWAEALINADLIPSVREGIDDPVRIAGQRFEEAQRRGEIPSHLPAEGIARAMIAAYQGFVLQRAWDRNVEVEPYLQVMEYWLDTLFRGPGSTRRTAKNRSPSHRRKRK